MAMEAKRRQAMAVHVGDGRRASGEQLWAKIPAVDRPRATFDTDCDELDKGVMLPAQHKALTPHARTPTHVVRVNNTLRPRVSRRVHDTLSFCKKRANHVGAIKFFICHDKLANAAA
jgi:insertion element IS1 protein InsB